MGKFKYLMILEQNADQLKSRLLLIQASGREICFDNLGFDAKSPLQSSSCIVYLHFTNMMETDHKFSVAKATLESQMSVSPLVSLSVTNSSESSFLLTIKPIVH